MIILIVYLTFKDFASLLAFIHLCSYFVILLGDFTSFFYLFLFILKQSLEDVIQGSCSTSMLNELKYACENVFFLLKLQAIGQQLY